MEGDLHTLEARFGTATNSVTGEVHMACSITVEDKEYVGIGETKLDAMKDAFKQAFPKLQTVEISDQVAWSEALHDG
jgi:hypothetical protein